jgi:hypothetical protein
MPRELIFILLGFVALITGLVLVSVSLTTNHELFTPKEGVTCVAMHSGVACWREE